MQGYRILWPNAYLSFELFRNRLVEEFLLVRRTALIERDLDKHHA
jgi:hypothetical protein